MVPHMPHHPGPAVVNHLPDLLRRRTISWSEFGRRTLLPPRHLARLRAPGANPHLAVAERVASALGVPVETVWVLTQPHACPR